MEPFVSPAKSREPSAEKQPSECRTHESEVNFIVAICFGCLWFTIAAVTLAACIHYVYMSIDFANMCRLVHTKMCK